MLFAGWQYFGGIYLTNGCLVRGWWLRNILDLRGPCETVHSLFPIIRPILQYMKSPWTVRRIRRARLLREGDLGIGCINGTVHLNIRCMKMPMLLALPRPKARPIAFLQSRGKGDAGCDSSYVRVRKGMSGNIRGLSTQDRENSLDRG